MALRPKNLSAFHSAAVMAGADRNAAGGVAAADRMLNHGRGGDAQIDDVVSAGEQAGQQAFADHDAARARVAADHHGTAWFEECAEGGGEIEDVRSGERGADHAPQAHVGNTQRIGSLG